MQSDAGDLGIVSLSDADTSDDKGRACRLNRVRVVQHMFARYARAWTGAPKLIAGPVSKL
jgi:hypothetical protein